MTSLLSDARPSPAGNRDGHAAISHALDLLGWMARDLTQGRPGDVVSITLDGESLGGVGKMQLRPDALDRLMDGEPNESHEDFRDLDHLVIPSPDRPNGVAHLVHVTYTPQWGGGSVSCRVVACYDAEPAWLRTLLGTDGTPDEDLAPALAASLANTRPPLYRCASPTCPGLPYRASEMAHPAGCGGGK